MFTSHKKFSAIAMTICLGVLISSCGLPSEAERLRNDNQKKVDWVCPDVGNQINSLIDAGNDLITYEYDYGWYLEYKKKYESVQDELISIDDELSGPTLIVRQAVREIYEIAANPDSVITSLSPIKVSTDRQKWNRRIAKFDAIRTVLKVLCSDDETRIDGIEYSADSECDISCQFSQKSKVEDLVVPIDSNGKQDKFGFWEYRTTVGSVDEISKFYLSNLGSSGWKIQLGESNFGPVSEDGFLVAQVWCRTKPRRTNLLVVVSALTVDPGTTSISLGTDRDASMKCE